MFEKFLIRSLAVVAAAALLASTGQAVAIDLVPVGNPGNAADPETGYGSVAEAYLIGKYEVTNAQWREFLTAKATLGDPNGLYNPDMAGTYGGIDRSGSGTVEDPYVYSAKGGDTHWDNRPVNYVSFWDAARFCNWLHNGQGDGDTESGAYVNIGDQDYFARQPGATYFIPTENEWYKAAYYDPSDYDPDGLGGVDPGPGYWDYPTQSDTGPTAEAPAGTDMINGSANCYWNGTYVDPTYCTTEVGAYITKPSDSAYGTFDQGGNLWEWNETALSSSRALRGGSWVDVSYYSGIFTHRSYNPTLEFSGHGFRVASIPEPGSIALLVCGLVAGLIWWRRRR